MSTTQDPPQAPGDPCAVDGDLGWALGMVFRSYLKAANLAMTDLPGGPRGYQVLTTAVQGVPSTQLALAQQLGVDRTVMTYLLDDLEQAGLIERRPDPTDRRARHIIATERGHARLDELQLRLRHVEDEVLAALEGPERDVFRDLIRRMATNSEPSGAEPCTVVQDIALAEANTSAKPRRGRRSPTGD
ncbi:hypothetical protein Misp01_04760 [Microtetraspora sp. NBRC 13810]|uniref:MarR family winged helix-turn-helix transcriptional regulator n=1 Tax=Microtetraspora sp. NBRC 13810 TaxID=3030990 RepID=UPI0024A0E6F1|nr:MarR family winged helix-turn-helix transcriptional regulator [Microtetraspora sp. NBRC 13810]GLW05346.1 hypothetical protein Misp01_04760 [Microtetraspora sp. NBRC 13810]